MKKILMVGPARSVKGGMTTVVDNYYYAGLDKKVSLKYIETINDKNKVSKFISEVKGKVNYILNIKKYEIVHIHVASRRSTFRKSWYVRLAKKYNKKVILHIHGAGYKKFYSECSQRQKEYIKRTFELCDKVIVLSEEWYDYFKELMDEKKIEVIYNSIIMPSDFEKNLDTNKFLFLGRIGNRKGIFDLLEVFSQIVDKYPNIKLYVGGDGEIERLKREIIDKKLSNNVEYIGWISGNKKMQYLKECSFYVLPSYNEGMPMSVLEGMAYKNVTLSTNVGGIPKVIENLQNGIIFNPGDINTMKKNIVMLLEDEKLRKKLSENAYKTIKNKFDINELIKKVLELYENV